MPHMHWVARQNKLELPNDEGEVNTRDIHKCDGQAHDPVTVVCIFFLFNGFGVFFSFIRSRYFNNPPSPGRTSRKCFVPLSHDSGIELIVFDSPQKISIVSISLDLSHDWTYIKPSQNLRKEKALCCFCCCMRHEFRGTELAAFSCFCCCMRHEFLGLKRARGRERGKESGRQREEERGDRSS